MPTTVPNGPSTRARGRGRGVAIAWAIAATTALLVGGDSRAAEGFSIAVSPSRVVFDAVPGVTTAKDLTIYNNGSEAVSLRITTGDFLIDDPTGTSLTFSVAAWIRTDIDQLLIAAGGRSQVRVIADIPADAAPGGYQAGVYIMTEAGPGQASRVAGRLATAVLIELPHEDRPLRRELQVTGHEITVDFPVGLSLEALFSPTLRTETRVANLGETFVRALAVDIYDPWTGPEPVRHEVPGATIFRGANGRFTTEARSMPWIGPASVTTEVVYERGANDYARIVVRDEVFIVPWRLLLLVGAVLSVTLGTVLTRRRRGRGAQQTGSAT